MDFMEVAFVSVLKGLQLFCILKYLDLFGLLLHHVTNTVLGCSYVKRGELPLHLGTLCYKFQLVSTI